MSDPTPTPVTTIVDANEALKELLNTSGNGKLTDLGKDLLDVKTGISELGQQLISATTNFSGFIEEMGASGAAATLFTAHTSEAVIQLNALGFGALKTSTAFDVFKTSLDGTGVFANASGSYKNLTDQMTALGIKTDNTSNVFGRLFNEIGKFGAKFMENATAGQALEAGIISMASASGELGTKLGLAGENFERIPNFAVQYSDRIGLVAKSTGLSTDNVGKFVNQMSEVPGAFNSIAVTGTGVDKVMTSVGGALALAAASGRDQTAVIKDLKEGYENLNLSADKALQYTALINESSARLGLRIKDTDDYFGALITSFKYLGNTAGDNQNVMEGAASTLQRYSGALKDTGLSSKATTELIADMSKSIGHMDTATKAFLANRSGLGSGLQGAFKIDLLQKQGKTDEIVKMIEQDLKKQFGGRIVTLEQAATNSDSAAQYQKQLAMINQGAYKQFLGSGQEADQKAGRLFEALAGGKVGEAGEVLTGQKALASSIDKGTTLQQRQVTELTKIQADTERSANLNAIVAAGTLKNTFGTGTERKTEEREKLLFAINDAMSLAAHVKLPTAKGESGGAGDVAHEVYGNLKDDAGSMFKGIGNMKDIFADSIGTVFTAGKAAFEEKSKKDAVEAEKQNGLKLAEKQAAGRATPATAVANTMKTRNQPNPRATVAAPANKTPDNKNNSGDLSNTFNTNDFKPLSITIIQECPECHKKGVHDQAIHAFNQAQGQASTQVVNK